MSADLRAALRKRKPDKRLARLAAPPIDGATHWTSVTSGRPALLLDTTVYIHSAAGRLPAGLGAMLDRALLFHSGVALGELAVGIANADPLRGDWGTLRDHYTALFEAIPESRILVPDGEIWLDAGLVAGTLARTQNFQDHQRKACLNDALIFLSAARAGLPVLTANRGDFALIRHLAPEGRYLHY